MHWRIQRALYRASRLEQAWRRLQWNVRARNYPHDDVGLVRLHIGCGEIEAPGFVNIDARRYSHVHIVTRNLFALKAVPDGAASMVYMCHVLEHVSFRLVHRVLREMRRVLAPGGTLRLSVPDLDLVIAMYEANNRRPAAIIGALMGAQDYAFNFHYNVFTKESLRVALSEVGFVDVRTWDPMNCRQHDFEDWASRSINFDGQDFPVSLNLEATAPRGMPQ